MAARPHYRRDGQGRLRTGGRHREACQFPWRRPSAPYCRWSAYGSHRPTGAGDAMTIVDGNARRSHTGFRNGRCPPAPTRRHVDRMPEGRRPGRRTGFGLGHEGQPAGAERERLLWLLNGFWTRHHKSLINHHLRFEKPKEPQKPFRFPFVYGDDNTSQTPSPIEGEQKPWRGRLLRLLPSQLAFLLGVAEHPQKPFGRTGRLLNGLFGSSRAIGGIALEFTA